MNIHSNYPLIFNQKPLAAWSPEDWRIAFEFVKTARRTWGRRADAWAYEWIGLPMPPQHILPGWWQRDFFAER